MSHEQMAKVIAGKEGSPCAFQRAIRVTERFKAQTVWTGIVYVFSLDRPPAEICYGWIDPDAKTLVTVLNRPPVTSPETAVRAYIMSQGQRSEIQKHFGS
jgi:hypothetical protein